MENEVNLNIDNDIFEYLCSAFKGFSKLDKYVIDDPRVKGQMRFIDYGQQIKVVYLKYHVLENFMFKSFNPTESQSLLLNINMSRESILKRINDIELQISMDGDSAALFYPRNVFTEHRLSRGDKSEALLIHIENTFISRIYGNDRMLKFINLSAYYGSRVSIRQENLLKDILGLTVDKGIAYSRVIEFLSIFLNRLENRIDGLKVNRLSTEDTITIQTVVANCFKDNSIFTINIPELAMRANMSNTKFNEGFKILYDLSPKKYLMMIKMKAAGKLIIDDELTIAEISDYVGYSDTSKFSRAFKNWAGVSPNKYC